MYTSDSPEHTAHYKKMLRNKRGEQLKTKRLIEPGQELCPMADSRFCLKALFERKPIPADVVIMNKQRKELMKVSKLNKSSIPEPRCTNAN